MSRWSLVMTLVTLLNPSNIVVWSCVTNDGGLPRGCSAKHISPRKGNWGRNVTLSDFYDDMTQRLSSLVPSSTIIQYILHIFLISQKIFHLCMLSRQLNTPIPYPDSKVHGANMGPTGVLSAPDGPHVGPMNLAIRDVHPNLKIIFKHNGYRR